MFAEFREVKIEELARTRELHGHTERVMRAVENCVNAMDDPDCLRAYLTELGRRHVYRSAKPSVGNVSATYPSLFLVVMLIRAILRKKKMAAVHFIPCKPYTAHKLQGKP